MTSNFREGLEKKIEPGARKSWAPPLVGVYSFLNTNTDLTWNKFLPDIREKNLIAARGFRVTKGNFPQFNVIMHDKATTILHILTSHYISL